MKIIRSQEDLDRMIEEAGKRNKEMIICTDGLLGFSLVIYREANGDYYIFSYHDGSHNRIDHGKEFPMSYYGKLMKDNRLFTTTF